jgi:uncharacterized protein
MDYGRLTLGNDILHLNGTPGQARFDFMWEILAKEMDAFIVVVDSTDPPSFPDAAELVDLFYNFHNVPRIIAANKTDIPGAASLSQVIRGVNPEGTVTVMPCVATQKSSVRQVLLQVVDLIKS